MNRKNGKYKSSGNTNREMKRKIEKSDNETKDRAMKIKREVRRIEKLKIGGL